MTDESRWAAASSKIGGHEYAAHFAELARAGNDVHGEATMCASLVAPGARILDAGCGTGRVAIRLAELGYECVGVDNDVSMLNEAQAASAGVTWLLCDLADLDERVGSFDLVVAAGNVMPLLAPGTEAAVIARLANRIRPNGLLITGFGLDVDHLPLTEIPFGLTEFDSWCAIADLHLEERFDTWQGDAFTGGGYAVSLYRGSATE
jgi:SAM-dependent methyltransferase